MKNDTTTKSMAKKTTTIIAPMDRRLDMLASEADDIIGEIRNTTRGQIDELVYLLNECLGLEDHSLPASLEERLELRTVGYRHAMNLLQSLHHIEMILESMKSGVSRAKAGAA